MGGTIHALRRDGLAIETVPAAMRLHGRTRRWIETAGGKWLPGVSRVRIIGGRLPKVGRNRNAQLAVNAANVTRYLLKAANAETGARLDLTRAGRGGEIDTAGGH